MEGSVLGVDLVPYAYTYAYAVVSLLQVQVFMSSSIPGLDPMEERAEMCTWGVRVRELH